MAFLLHSSPQEEDGGGRRRVGGEGNRSGQGLHSCLTKSRNRVIRESDVDVEEHADANLSSSERSHNLDPSITAPPRAAARNPQVKPKKSGAKWPSAAVYVTRASERKGQIESIHALLSQSATAAQTQPNAAVPLRHRRPERDAAAAARRWNARRSICSNSAELLRRSDGITKTHAHTQKKPRLLQT